MTLDLAGSFEVVDAHDERSWPKIIDRVEADAKRALQLLKQLGLLDGRCCRYARQFGTQPVKSQRVNEHDLPGGYLQRSRTLIERHVPGRSVHEVWSRAA
ncbi:MAG: hypothetical protein ACRDU5_00920 [Mycobacterium sp.]